MTTSTSAPTRRELDEIVCFMRNHPAVRNVSARPVIHVVVTLEHEWARKQIYEMEAALLDKYQGKFQFDFQTVLAENTET